MRRLAIALIGLLLVLPPLAGAMASALGYTTAHHHCHNPMHGDEAQTPTPQPTHHDDNAPLSDPFQCDDCHIAMAAIVVVPMILPVRPVVSFDSDFAKSLQPRTTRPLFRPPTL